MANLETLQDNLHPSSRRSLARCQTNRHKYPLSPELWFTSRDQMHQIRKLARKLGFERN